ncbi:MAG: 3'-5' exonuclease, partial [Alphaproteobacteria bacterium]
EFFAGSGIHSDENRTLFVVGDEKQSIFSFQRADPEAFAEMRSYFAKRIEDADKIYDEVPMRVSFRSAPAILKAVDAVFSGQHEGVSSEPMQHFAASPRPHQPEKMGRVEVWPLLQTPPKDKASEDWVLPLGYEPEHDPQAELAKQIATTIKNWLTVKEVLPGYDRPIGAGDIMILLRRRGRFADLMVRALKNQHIDVTGVDRMYLVKQLPVMDLLAMMQFVLLPEDDLNLATVLRGPLLNISEDQLMDLAIKREGSLWASLSENSAFIKEYSYLLGWLDRVDFVSPFTFLSSLLSEACPASLVSGRHALWSRLGPDALDPIDELLNAVQDFSRRHSPSMQHFLQWLMATETEIKRELDRSGGQVRIMTVHASKGLEAPIVFLPDTSKVPRTQDVPKLLWDKNEIPFYLARQPKRGVIKPLWERARLKQMQEYRRLLYVALTRAANRLYVCGWETGNQSMSESWYYQVHDGLKALHQPGFIDPQTPAEIVIADPEIKTQLRKEKAPLKAEPPSLPAWAKENAVEELPAPRTLAPSRHIQEMATATPDSRFVRGRIIHRLLQSLPDVVDAKRDEAASRFLLNPQHGLTPEQQKEIKDEVLRNLIRNPLYAPLFGAASRAEVPLVGLVHGRVVSGQVDRLCLKGDEIWIVDYKTNRPPPEKIEAVPEPYRLQMADYKGVLEAIYPGRTVRCFLLWTYAPKLMELL